MDTQNQPAPVSIPDSVQASPTVQSAPASTDGRESSSRMLFSAVAILILIVAGGAYIAFTKNKASSSSASIPGEGEGSLPSFAFSGKKYARINTFPPSEDSDLASESYEWTPKGESADSSTSLITTHKISSKDPSKPISAKLYAESVATANEKQGASIIETSVINTPDAIKEAGIDPNNPPYLIIYAFPSNGTVPIEVDMQKVINGPDGTVEAFVYSFPLNAKTEQEVTSFFQSDEFVNKRADVIKAPFPY